MTVPLRELAPSAARRLLALGAAGVMLAGCTADSSGEVQEPPTDAAPTRTASGSDTAGCGALDAAVRRVTRGWVPGRAPDIVPIPARPTYIGGSVNPVHTGPWDYLAHGSGDESTMRDNVVAWTRWRLRPQVLRDMIEEPA